MSEAHNLDDARPRPQAPRAAELAAHLAARMCHDFISPASAIVSGLDLLEDPTAQDLREEAMVLIGSSARKLAELLSFSRVAFGASATAETFDVRVLEDLTRGIFGHMRAELDWQVTPAAVNKPTARVLLNIAQMGGAALPTGGVARVRVVEEAGVTTIAVECEGARARLRPEALEGLRGEALTQGLHGQWVQAYYLHLVATDAGGRVFADSGDAKVTIAATLPASGG
jgi:histidine phosphotransferase ChpT